MLPPLGDYTELLQDVWASGWLANGGAQHQALEAELAQWLQVPHLSLFNNGTIALMVACQALRLTGEVITTPFTFPATPHVLRWNNITPVFADIDPETLCIDPAGVESRVTPSTTGILGVHVYGVPCDVHALDGIARSHGLRVVYDGAHAFGTQIDGQTIASFGDATMLSFHATKLFHTAEGGALAVNDPELKQRIDLLKNFGIKNEEEVVMPGINGKMSEIEGSEQTYAADLVFLAMGFVNPVAGLLDAFAVDKDARGNAKATTDGEGCYATSAPKVYVAGDTRRGQSLVVWAIREGRQAARAVDEFLMGYSDLPR